MANKIVYDRCSRVTQSNTSQTNWNNNIFFEGNNNDDDTSSDDQSKAKITGEITEGKLTIEEQPKTQR